MATQCERLLEYLKEHKEIQPLKAWRELGIYRLGARVFDLRKDGHNIASDYQTITNRFGAKCRVATYRLSEEQAG